jgi:hypothetical protein
MATTLLATPTPGNFRLLTDDGQFLPVVPGASQPNPPLLPSMTQEVYVNKGGNDVSGDGTVLNPFLTIARAMADITDASAAKRYGIIIGPGEYADPFALKPWVGIVALDGGENGASPNGAMVTELTVPANGITFDPSWSASGFSVSWFGGLGFTNAQTFDQATIPGALPQLNFKACAFNALMSFLGPGTAGVDNVLWQDCLAYGGVTVTGWQFLWTRHTEFLGGTIAVASPGAGETENTTWLAQDCSVGSNVAATNVTLTGGAPHSAVADLSNTAVVGTLTITGANTAYRSTAEGIPPSVTLAGGASAPVVQGGLGYNPLTPANWHPPPAQVFAALDQLANVNVVQQEFLTASGTSSVTATTPALTRRRSGLVFMAGFASVLPTNAGALTVELLRGASVIWEGQLTNSAGVRYMPAIVGMDTLPDGAPHTYSMTITCSAGTIGSFTGQGTVLAIEL